MRRFRDISIGRKLTLVIMLISGVALLLACSAFLTHDLVTLRRTTARNLSMLAKMIGANSKAPIVFGDRGAAEETLAVLSAERHIVAACIYTADGKVFAYYLREDADRGLLPAKPGREGYSFRGDRLVVFHRLYWTASRSASSTYNPTCAKCAAASIGMPALSQGSYWRLP